MLLNWSNFANAAIDNTLFLKNANHNSLFLDQITKSIIYIKSCSLFIDDYLKSLSNSEFVGIYGSLFGIDEIFNLNYSGESFLAGLMITSLIDKLLSSIGRHVQKARTGLKTKHNQIKKVRLPIKMRDLLESEIMATTLGTDIIYLLRLFIAHPIGINIKNLMWHGFVSDAEHEPSYVAFAIVIALSLAKIYMLISSVNCLSYRSFEAENKFLKTLDQSAAISIIKSSDFIHPSRLNIVLKSINFYFEKEYRYFIQLIFPEIENGLRCIYATINNLDACATQRDEKMVTLVNILAQDSNIITILGESIMHLLFDLLIWKSGPQLRDGISHRLINDNSISEIEHNHTFILFLLLCQHDKNDPFVEEFNSTYVPMYHPLHVSLDYINKIGNFSSQLHDICSVHKINMTDVFNKLESKVIRINTSDIHVYQSKEANQIFSIIYGVYHSCENIYNQLVDFYYATKFSDRQRASFLILSDNFYLFGDMLHFFELICKYAIGISLYGSIEQVGLVIPKLILCQNTLIGQLGSLVNQKKRMYSLAIATFFCYLGPDLISNVSIDIVNKTVKKQLDAQFLKLIES
jgi:hypothetical protein